MARGRARRSAAGLGERHPARAVQRRALRPARGRDRAVRRLPAVRWRDRRPHPGPDDPAAPDRRHGRRLRAGVLDDDARRGARPLARDAGRRPARRDLAARGRPGQPHRPDHGAGQGRPAAGRPRRGADPGAGRAGARRCRHRRAHRPRRRRGRGGRELRRPVGGPGRRDGRRARAAALGRALLRRHRPDRGRHAGPADPARPGRLHLLQGGGRRPGRRRLRARGQAVGGPGPGALPLRVPAARGGLGPLRRPDGQRRAPDPGARRDRDPQVLQRSRVVHARQPVPDGRGAGRARLLRRGRLQLRRHRVRGRGRPGAGRVGGRGRADQRPGGRGPPPVRAVPRRAGLAAAAGRGDPRAALRRAVAQPRARERATAAAVPRSTTGSPPATRASVRRWAGSGPTSSPRPAGRRSSTTPGAGRPGCRGRPPSSGPPGRRWPCSTRPRSRSTSSPVATPRRPCSGSAPTTWRCRSARSSTPVCSTGAAPTRPT